MKPVFCAAVDLGATSGRVIVGAWDGDLLALHEVHRFSHRFHSLGVHDYWDLPGLWAEVRAGLLEAKRRFPTLISIGVDTWGVDHVLVDAGGRPVFPVHAYRDGRTADGFARLENSPVDLVRHYAATGIPNLAYNTSLQLAETVATYPAIRQIANRCLLLPDFFNFLLSGRMENECAIASTTQLLDVHTCDWSRPTLDAFDIPASWFTAPIPADTILGPVRNLPELTDVTCVAVPGHDTACAYASMPADTAGTDLYLSSGTWSLLGYESATPLLGPDALTAGISNERMGRGGFRPLAPVPGLWLLEQTLADLDATPTDAAQWSTLIAAATVLPPTTVLLDVNDPAFAKPVSMRAAIDRALTNQRTAPPTTAAGYVRLISDSLAAGHSAAKTTFERLAGRQFSRILMVGGGSKNPLLCQATADAAGIPVVALPAEGSALGNLASQLIAHGVFSDLAAFRETVAAATLRVHYSPQDIPHGKS